MSAIIWVCLECNTLTTENRSSHQGNEYDKWDRLDCKFPLIPYVPQSSLHTLEEKVKKQEELLEEANNLINDTCHDLDSYNAWLSKYEKVVGK